MNKVRVTSEVGRLRRVITHEPGRELLAVTPSNRQEYLYDDIIDLELSREEHGHFTSILRHFTEVLSVRTLLQQTLEVPEAREFLIRRSVEVTADPQLGAKLEQWSSAEIAQRLVEGWRRPTGKFSERLKKLSYVLPPVPNLFFTRDSAIVVGDAVLISAMRFAPRWPEEVFMRTIFGFHPTLGSPAILYDGSDERRHDHRVEGGDFHPLREDLVAIGISERTSPAAVDLLTQTVFEHTPITDVIAVVLPDHSTAIHLDMVWTQVDRELCVAHPPMFEGPTRAPVLHWRKGKDVLLEPSTLWDAFREVDFKMEPVWAGGDTPEGQEREQWASGCNFFAVAPGQAISYARNEGTLRSLELAGFRLVQAEDLLLGKDRVEESDRVIITFHGSELVRGGGGPRCMTCPVLRDDL